MDFAALPDMRKWLEPIYGRVTIWKREALPTGVFLLAVMVCGVIFGAVVAGQLNPATTNVLSQTMSQFLVAVRDHHLVSPNVTLWQRSVSEVKLFALIWLSGVSLLGLPLVTLVLFFRTFSIGFSVAYSVLEFGWHGLLVASLVIFVHQILALGCLWFAGVTAIRLSSSVVHRAFSFHELPGVLIRYTGVMLLCLSGAFVAALYQAYVAPSILAAVLGA
ncbi:stage II sporulation protein M [Alicyclobacillus curvatus]|nr:stage II sporulation protein M [Alicyclobacillus curvatus]